MSSAACLRGNSSSIPTSQSLSLSSKYNSLKKLFPSHLLKEHDHAARGRAVAGGGQDHSSPGEVPPTHLIAGSSSAVVVVVVRGELIYPKLPKTKETQCYQTFSGAVLYIKAGENFEFGER